MKVRTGPTDRIYPMPCPLVVGGSLERSDLLAVAWIGIASSTPPSLAMALRRTRRTLELIRETGEFTVNIPPTALAAQVDYCGITSGRETDKLADTGLTLSPGSTTRTPIVDQCPYNLECRVTREVELGEYVLVIGEIVDSHAEESILVDGKVDAGLLDPLVYIAGMREYRGLSGKIADAFSIGRSLGDRS
jgi:flavin reductase (DIM6/NTAB) family NADH-FMN oxidoreductase RutF